MYRYTVLRFAALGGNAAVCSMLLAAGAKSEVTNTFGRTASRMGASEDISVRKYQDDKDFEEALKNLSRPIQSVTKNNQCEPLQYNLLKELGSYLVHLKESENDSGVFVEAALMIQNVIFINQKRVDQLVDVMKLIEKF